LSDFVIDDGYSMFVFPGRWLTATCQGLADLAVFGCSGCVIKAEAEAQAKRGVVGNRQCSLLN